MQRTLLCISCTCIIVWEAGAKSRKRPRKWVCLLRLVAKVWLLHLIAPSMGFITWLAVRLSPSEDYGIILSLTVWHIWDRGRGANWNIPTLLTLASDKESGSFPYPFPCPPHPRHYDFRLLWSPTCRARVSGVGCGVGSVTNMVSLCPVYQAPSYEPNLINKWMNK